MKQETMYDLLYISGGKVMEVVETNKSISICKWRASQLKATTHKQGLLQSRKVSSRPIGGWQNAKLEKVEKTVIECFSVGMTGTGKCPFQTIAVTVSEDRQTITKISDAWSTESKWQSHDIGFERKSNMPVWCRDYDKNRKKYNDKFGEGEWGIVWHSEIPEDLKGVFNATV